jgi:hypothetical protein
VFKDPTRGPNMGVQRPKRGMQRPLIKYYYCPNKRRDKKFASTKTLTKNDLSSGQTKFIYEYRR